MCHIIINKTQASPLHIEGEHRHTQCRVIICLFCWPAAACMAFVWFSHEQYWGKPWMNYCTFLLFNSFISDFKDCQHHESISLYNVHNYRALVQHWKVERRRNSFLCLLFYFLVLVTALLLSLRTDPYSPCRSPLLSHVCLVGGCRHVVSWPKFCLNAT